MIGIMVSSEICIYIFFLMLKITRTLIKKSMATDYIFGEVYKMS